MSRETYHPLVTEQAGLKQVLFETFLVFSSKKLCYWYIIEKYTKTHLLRCEIHFHQFLYNLLLTSDTIWVTQANIVHIWMIWSSAIWALTKIRGVTDTQAVIIRPKRRISKFQKQAIKNKKEVHATRRWTQLRMSGAWRYKFIRLHVVFTFLSDKRG